jgi:hypothetical protein
MGLNRPALDIKGGYTFLSMETGTEVSAAAGVTFNLRNTATDYQSGTEFHIEGALNQHFPFGLAAGVGGFFISSRPVTPDQAPCLAPLEVASPRLGCSPIRSRLTHNKWPSAAGGF